MEGGRAVKDRSVALTNDTNGSFTTDDISKENVALWYLGEHTAVLITAGTGERVINKKVATPFNADATLQLLYGPSVDQIMLDAAVEEGGAILEDVDTEFLRNFSRLTEKT